MAVLHPWCLRYAFPCNDVTVYIDLSFSHDFFQHRQGHSAGTKNCNRIIIVAFDNSRFDTDMTGTSIDDHIDPSIHIVGDFSGCRRAGAARPVGAGSRDRYTGRLEERMGNIMVRAT